MNVSWIEEIYNNTDDTFAMWSTDSEHNGVFDDIDTKERVGDNDWGHVLVIGPRSRIKASHCGIPWYKDGTTYRVIAKGTRRANFGLKMHQAETDLGDGIVFINHATGDEMGRVPFQTGADRQFALLISKGNGELEFKLHNRQSKTTKQEFVALLGKWAKDFYEDTRQLRVELAKALVEGAIKGG